MNASRGPDNAPLGHAVGNGFALQYKRSSYILSTSPFLSTSVMDSLQNQKKPLTLKPGLVNFPGATPASTALVVELLRKDVAEHHCYFNDDHFHNHLSHQ
jgi:hypothetical protein